MDLAK
jgi:hypothetical protein